MASGRCRTRTPTGSPRGRSVAAASRSPGPARARAGASSVLCWTRRSRSSSSWGRRSWWRRGLCCNGLYQVARKPTELFFPVSGTLSKTPRRDLATVRADASASTRPPSSRPTFLAALAQVEGAGNPVARTYWRWRLTWHPFELYRPASSAVGMYQITDGTFREARRYCIHDHAVVEDGPWHDARSCWFNGLYSRVVPSHAIEMTSALLDRQVARTLERRRSPRPRRAQKQDARRRRTPLRRGGGRCLCSARLPVRRRPALWRSRSPCLRRTRRGDDAGLRAAGQRALRPGSHSRIDADRARRSPAPSHRPPESPPWVRSARHPGPRRPPRRRRGELDPRLRLVGLDWDNKEQPRDAAPRRAPCQRSSQSQSAAARCASRSRMLELRSPGSRRNCSGVSASTAPSVRSFAQSL